jgi:hypothetical protein
MRLGRENIDTFLKKEMKTSDGDISIDVLFISYRFPIQAVGIPFYSKDNWSIGLQTAKWPSFCFIRRFDLFKTPRSGF